MNSLYIALFIIGVIFLLVLLSNSRSANIAKDGEEDAKHSTPQEIYDAMHPKPKTQTEKDTDARFSGEPDESEYDNE